MPKRASLDQNSSKLYPQRSSVIDLSESVYHGDVCGRVNLLIEPRIPEKRNNYENTAMLCAIRRPGPDSGSIVQHILRDIINY